MMGVRLHTVGDLANYFAGGCIIVETLPVPSKARQPDMAPLPIPSLLYAPEWAAGGADVSRPGGTWECVCLQS